MTWDTKKVRDRFWNKTAVDVTTPVINGHHCRVWLASTNKKGYGWFYLPGFESHGGSSRKSTQTLAHRVAYALHFGALVPDLDVDHQCCNTSCVEPQHLQQEIPAVNNSRRGPMLKFRPAMDIEEYF